MAVRPPCSCSDNSRDQPFCKKWGYENHCLESALYLKKSPFLLLTGKTAHFFCLQQVHAAPCYCLSIRLSNFTFFLTFYQYFYIFESFWESFEFFNSFPNISPYFSTFSTFLNILQWEGHLPFMVILNFSISQLSSFSFKIISAGPIVHSGFAE